jgi:magnesium transporter
MDAFASIISNNLNVVMKILTSITIVMAVPTIIASFFGMNVPMPWGNFPWAFPAVIFITLFICAVVLVILIKKRLF